MIGGGKDSYEETSDMTDEVGTTSKISEYFRNFMFQKVVSNSFLNEIFKKFEKVHYEI